MRLVEGRKDSAVLTDEAGTRRLVELHERKGVRPAASRRHLGLYHFAILLPDRAALGRFVRHVAALGVRVGASDHRVSEALYLSDPDGLGIEVYADRPREQWTRRGRELVMATDPLDFDEVVRAAGDGVWTGMPAGTVMGHVHLHVGDLRDAAAFFSEGLGFDRVVWSYPGALFLSAGGYHHHLGTNTWAGADAAIPGTEDARLLHWTLELPSVGALDDVGVALAAGGYSADRASERELRARDPWGTVVRVIVAD
jgi:catechol 2,3-dioxygenase